MFDLNARFESSEKTGFRMGVTNAFNKKPPQVGDTEANYEAQNYDVIGRYFFMGSPRSSDSTSQKGHRP